MLISDEFYVEPYFTPIKSSSEEFENIKLIQDDKLIEVHYELSSTRTNHKNLQKKINNILDNLNSDDKNKDITIIFLVSDFITPSVKEAIRLLTNKHKIFIQVFPIRTCV
jgi:hypothetical protein